MTKSLIFSCVQYFHEQTNNFWFYVPQLKLIWINPPHSLYSDCLWFGGPKVISGGVKLPFHHRTQTASGDHPTACQVGIVVSFPGVKVDGVWRWWFTWSMLRSVICVATPQVTHMPSWHDIRFSSGKGLCSPLSQATVTFHAEIYYSQYEQSWAYTNISTGTYFPQILKQKHRLQTFLYTDLTVRRMVTTSASSVDQLYATSN